MEFCRILKGGGGGGWGVQKSYIGTDPKFFPRYALKHLKEQFWAQPSPVDVTFLNFFKGPLKNPGSTSAQISLNIQWIVGGGSAL